MANICNFWVGGGYDTADIAGAYLLFLEDTMKETKYFVENKSEHYRYSTYGEVADKVYNNAPYMEKYMVGLQLSGYIWSNHMVIHRFFSKLLDGASGGNYLEVGPGHGRYFAEAVSTAHYNRYTAVDVSDTSLAMTKKYVRHTVPDTESDVEYVKGDFLDLDSSRTYDMIVISEVLEHVESPAAFLEKAYSLLSDRGILYINVPINAPAIDHIFLFHSVEEVEALAAASGFTIADKCVATGNDIPYEKAVKKKRAINLALALKKSREE